MRYKHILNSISQRSIVFYGLIISALLMVMAYLIVIYPLADQLKENKATILSLENELDTLLSKQAACMESIPSSLEFAQALSFVKDFFEANGVMVQEIMITQLAVQDINRFNQALVKIMVNADQLVVVEKMGEIIHQNRFPFILQEIDIGSRNIEISLKILYFAV